VQHGTAAPLRDLPSSSAVSNESPVPTTISKVRQTRINDNPALTYHE
jgi:hypothetical protein